MKKNKIEFIGKSLLIDNSILVIGDLHLGYEGSLHKSGILIKTDLYEQTIKDLGEIFDYIKNKNYVEKKGRIKKSLKSSGGDNSSESDGGAVERKVVNKVIILGDLKHEFGSILREEWKEILELIDYLKEKTKELIIVKGNHDIFTDKIIKKKELRVVDYYLWEEFAFLHGDRDFREIYGATIKRWIIGHGHPAIVLEEKRGIKKEKYKCFLVGKYRNKEIVILPSFFPLVEGTDVRSYNLGLAWNFEFEEFKVKIVGEELNVFDFGKLERI